MFDLSGVPPERAFPMFGLIAAVLIVVALCARYLGKHNTIVAPRITDRAPPPKDDREEWRLGRSILGNVCPDCGQTDFYEGPHAGMNVNIYCANSECRHGFNVANFGNGIVWAERIGNGPDQLYR